MNIDHVVMNIQNKKEGGWVAERLDGVIIPVEPDNYTFWAYCGAYTVYTRKVYDENNDSL
jgi:hypothetical protein